ncbi:tetratricopeptide repeat protein, partial [Candidatus Sumerlaeota bacterium]|nr:tetratricopeptide repeat protein [Candidatus Sumerlaeota bacterium]
MAVLAASTSPCCFLFAASSSDTPRQDYTALWSRGDYHKALQTLEALLKERGQFPPTRWLADRAELLYETGRTDEAIGQLENLQDR